MLGLASIVEGEGEVKALPVLLKRVLTDFGAVPIFNIRAPIRQNRYRIVKIGELERAVELAARTISRCGAILVVLDSEGAAPCLLGPQLVLRAQNAAGGLPIRVVLAHREWEAWYLAAIASLAGRRNLFPDLQPPPDPEAISGAKEWLARHMPKGKTYSPSLDQPAFADVFDLDAARAAPSFAKFCRDIRSLVDETRQKFPDG
jgi:hypothetical protein